ncbi:serine/threonine-protein kinase [Nocardioides sp. J54]|uniref:serine/threonine-protein kinase n=1 Tax=Nocardioides sp. J54 TaxID=935866 RepID=UPI0004B482F6|nr:serine/threonine-protein kinase [Nocardioides sp. J54]
MGTDVLAGRYELQRLIGRGGNGEVWQALDRSLGRDVAVKVVDATDGDAPATRRFQQEARAAASLNHPHVVAVYDAGTDGQRAYLVMELLPGPPLSELVRREGPLSPERAEELAAQAAAGLEAVHGVGVVHRDVKPGNLVLDRQGRVKVVDFGIARVAESTATQVTATGMVVGSAPYLSPEQARGDTATPASDLYALGCTLMTLLTGSPPFTADHPLAVLRQHLDDAPPRVRERRPDVPPRLDAIVDDLLAKDPARRADGFAALLGRDTGQVASTAVLTAAGPQVPGTAVLPTTGSGRRLPVALVAGAAALAALVLLVVLLVALLGDDEPTRTAAAPASPSATTDRTDATDDAGATEPAPPPPSSPEQEPAPSDLAAAVAALDEVVDDEARSGGIDEKTADDLAKKVEDLREVAGGDEPADKVARDVDKALDDMVKKLDEAAGDSGKKGPGKDKGKGPGDREVTPAADARIRAAIDDVRAAA